MQLHVYRNKYVLTISKCIYIDLLQYVLTAAEENLQRFEKFLTREWMQGEELKHIASYVAFRFKAKCPHLGQDTSKLPFSSKVDWICTIFRGWCRYPCQDLIDIAIDMNKIF